MTPYRVAVERVEPSASRRPQVEVEVDAECEDEDPGIVAGRPPATEDAAESALLPASVPTFDIGTWALAVLALATVAFVLPAVTLLRFLWRER